MIITNTHQSPQVQNYKGIVSLRCPGCRQNGSFEGLPNVADILHFEPVLVKNVHRSEIWYLMQRFCPNPKCKTHVFIVLNSDGRILASYPPIRLDFDSTAIPSRVCKPFEEALSCHAQSCFTAAAIMIRKTLEELCEEQGATGKSLHDRIRNLSSKIILPKDLLEGLDHLRLLGNDAAHIESKHYNDIGTAELEAAIKVTKEVLKAVYQMAEIVAELKALRRPTS